jgi:hypothetical protein
MRVEIVAEERLADAAVADLLEPGLRGQPEVVVGVEVRAAEMLRERAAERGRSGAGGADEMDAVRGHRGAIARSIAQLSSPRFAPSVSTFMKLSTGMVTPLATKRATCARHSSGVPKTPSSSMT